MSHAALLGVGLGLLAGVDPMLGVGVFCVCLAVLLVGLERQRLLASDTLLGIMAHATLALGLILFSLMEHLRVDLMAYLFGDVLAIGAGDLVLIYAVTAVIGGILALIEVKTRSDLASAGEAITARQRARIARAAEAFLQQRPDFSQLSVRFDVILIARRRLPRHLMDAWQPGDRL